MVKVVSKFSAVLCGSILKTLTALTSTTEGGADFLERKNK